MKRPVVVIGIGEMGGVFARGFLRNGQPVVPATRGLSLTEAAAQTPNPELVLLAAAEKDLHSSLAAIPDGWKDRLGLLQNDYTNQTVISVWFEKKKGQDAKVLIPSPAFGPKAELLVRQPGRHRHTGACGGHCSWPKSTSSIYRH